MSDRAGFEGCLDLRSRALSLILHCLGSAIESKVLWFLFHNVFMKFAESGDDLLIYWAWITQCKINKLAQTLNYASNLPYYVLIVLLCKLFNDIKKVISSLFVSMFWPVNQTSQPTNQQRQQIPTNSPCFHSGRLCLTDTHGVHPSYYSVKWLLILTTMISLLSKVKHLNILFCRIQHEKGKFLLLKVLH